MIVQIFKAEDSTDVYLPYMPEIIALIKSIKGAKYTINPVKKWTIPTTQLENLVLLLNQNDVAIEYVSVPRIFQFDTNKENKIKKSVYVSIGDHDFILRLPTPQKVFDYLLTTPKKMSNNNFLINNEYFPAFFTFCFNNNLNISLV